MRTLITNGTVVTADGSYPRTCSSTARRSPRSDATLATIEGWPLDETIDATGKYVIPGAIDVHTHMELPFGGTSPRTRSRPGPEPRRSAARPRSSTSRSSARREPARGPRRLARQGRGQLRHRLRLPHDHERRQRRHARGDGPARRRRRDRLQALHRLPGVFYSDDGAISGRCSRPGRTASRSSCTPRTGSRSTSSPPSSSPRARPIRYYHGVVRYPIFEGEATNRVIRLAEAARVPVYIVHLRPATRSRRSARPVTRREGIRRDMPAVPVPPLDDMGNGFEGAKSSARRRCAGGPPGGALDRARQGRPPGGLDGPLPVRLPRARRSSARAISGRSPTGCPA